MSVDETMKHLVLTSVLALAVACSAAAEEPLAVGDAIDRALAHAPSILGAVAELDAAAAHVGEARAAFLPSVLAHGEYGRAHGFDEAVTNGGSTQAVARMEATLFDGGARRAALAAARARLRSARARGDQRRADVALAVRSAYATALAARAELEIDRDVERALETYAQLLARQDQIGAANENDVLRAKLGLRSQAAERRATESTLESALADLASLTGTELSAGSLRDFAVTLEPVASDLVAASPVVSDAREAAEAAARDAAALEGERIGKATLTADAGVIGVAFADSFERRSGAQFLLGFDVPLFDGGARNLRIAAARADARGAQSKVAEAARTVRLSVEHATSEARRAEIDAAAAREATDLAAKNFLLMEARHLGGGNVRLLEVLDALTQLSSLRLSVVRAELSLRLAAARAADAVGKVTP